MEWLWAFLIQLAGSPGGAALIAMLLTGLSTLIAGQHPLLAGLLTRIADFFRGTKTTVTVSRVAKPVTAVLLALFLVSGTAAAADPPARTLAVVPRVVTGCTLSGPIDDVVDRLRITADGLPGQEVTESYTLSGTVVFYDDVEGKADDAPAWVKAHPGCRYVSVFETVRLYSGAGAGPAAKKLPPPKAAAPGPACVNSPCPGGCVECKDGFGTCRSYGCPVTMPGAKTCPNCPAARKPGESPFGPGFVWYSLPGVGPGWVQQSIVDGIRAGKPLAPSCPGGVCRPAAPQFTYPAFGGCPNGKCPNVR